jgi:glycosyltransferase involved in cell wall biosynthesis
MKVTYICGFAWEPKGTVRARAFPLAEEMVRRGHEVTLIIAPYDNRAYSGVEFVRNGVRVVNFEIKPGIAGLVRIPYEIVQKIREMKPDLVHVFKPKGFAGLAATWLLLRNRPFVLDSDDWEGWGGWNETDNHSWPVKQFIDLQEKQLIRRSPAITVASRLLADRALSLQKSARQIFYVPNGPTSEQIADSSKLLEEDCNFYKTKFGLRGAPVILYAGHFNALDDVMFFCRSVVRAIKKPAHVVFIGDGPELPMVRSFFSARPKITARFLGALPSQQYAEVVAAADICAFPYPDTLVYRAKCSARIIDYMVYGKAVVTTSVGQNPEYIVHEESGLLAPSGDEAQFAKALTRVTEDSELRERLGRNARSRILRKFLWSGSAGDNCEHAYRSLVVQEQIKPVTSLAS